MNSQQRRQRKRLETRLRAEISGKEKEPQPDKKDTETLAPKRFRARAAQWSGRFWKAFLAAITVVGFAYSFRPEIDVDRDLSLNSQDPFATQFRITNTGRLAIYNLTFSCTINGPTMQDVLISSFGPGQQPIAVLESKKSATRNCSIGSAGQPPNTELLFDVTYTPKWFWRSSVNRTRFVNMLDSEGHLQWFKQP